MIAAIVLSIMAYLFGSLSSAVLVCKFFNLPDPRQEGSMNPGATNVLRIGGKVPALITLFGDLLKGFLPVFIAHLVGVEGFYVGVVALGAFLGHVFPLFFGFQGGKGVATSMGAFLALSPIAGVMIGLCWLIVAFISRYSSLSALISAVFAPIAMLIFAKSGYFLPVLAISAVLIWRHAGNIQRLRAGTESKINF